MKKKIDVSKSSIVISNQNMVPYLFNLDRIKKPNCNLCQFEFRDEIEEEYENQKRKNYSTIKRTLKDNYDFDSSVNSIKNHMLYHYKVPQNNVFLKEYADDIQRWVNMQTNRSAALKSRIAILEREMFTIAQSSVDLDITEKRKNAEVVKKLVETILVCESKLKDFEEQVKPVTLVFNQLKIIVNDELEHINNIKTKQVLGSVLSRLKESVGNMIID